MKRIARLITRYLNPRWAVFWYLLPILIVAVLGLVALVTAPTRWDNAYFTDTYLERYRLPAQVVIDAEGALRTNDQELLAALQGLRRPRLYEPNPDLTLVFAWEINTNYKTYNYLDVPYREWISLQETADFVTYVYIDEETLKRTALHVERVRGRWVLTPEDLHFFMYSGRWLRIAGPLAVPYWMILTITLTMIWLYRASRDLGDRLFAPLS